MSGPEDNPADLIPPNKEDYEAWEMEQRRDRINEVADAICRGKRYDAADSYIESAHIAEKITGDKVAADYHSFLAGWDAAMEIGNDAVNEENQMLHGIIHDLATRMSIDRCPKCKGEGVVWDSDDFEICTHPTCQQGWIDKVKP